MKKYLFNIFVLFSFFINFKSLGETDYNEYLQSIKEALYNEEFEFDEDGNEESYIRSVAYYLWNISSNSDINTLETIPGIYNFLFDYFPYFGDSFEHLIDLFVENNEILQTGNIAQDVDDIRLLLQDNNTYADESRDFLESIDDNTSNLSDSTDRLVLIGDDSNDKLSEIIIQLQALNGNTGGSTSPSLPSEQIGYYELNNYGRDIDTFGLHYKSFTTTGEYNKDVHRMLINLNQLGSSQNNAMISMLTNLQVIASSLSAYSDGEQKVEQDIEERENKAAQADYELDSITSQNWDNYFTVPRFVSDVYNNLTINLEGNELPSRINVVDTYHFNSESFTVELDNIGFDLPQAALDIAYYARIVFGFIYWSLTLVLAIFLFRLWIKLYFFVSQILMNK